MELPQPPADIELRTIIDKLAQFVARNGLEFEMMTKNKQKGNPKFSFLFGGDHFNYYQYKVTTEQAIIKVKAVRDKSQPLSGGSGQPLQPLMSQVGGFTPNSPTVPPTNQTTMQIINTAASAAQWLVNQQPTNPPPALLNPHGSSVDSIIEQQNSLNLQITQSEQNLAAQHLVLMQNLETQIEDALRKAQSESLIKRAEEHNVNLQEFDTMLQPIIDFCTKDSISAGKAWILAYTSVDAHIVVAQYLLAKVLTPGATFIQKLHIIYLVNDVMHHCVRKSADNLKKALQDVVVPMFCNTSLGIKEDQLSKLNKLLNLWETKSNYFSKEILAKLKTPEASWKEYEEDILMQNNNIVNPIKQAMKSTFETYQAQHQAFVNHALQQLQNLESQKLQLEQNQFQQLVMPHGHTPDAPNDVSLIPVSFDAPPPPIISNVPPAPLRNKPPLPLDIPFNQPPPGMFQHLPPDLIPDFSKPPPGFTTKEPAIDDLMPSVPYFELPAGLMVTMIKLDDFNYKPLDPGLMRLPPAVPPSDRLLQAVESFYQRNNGNTRERLILDADGWEKLGLYEYYKAKNAAKKKKEEELANGLREKSRSPSPIVRQRSRSRSPKKKRYRSKSRSPSRDRSRSRSKSPSRHHRSSNGKKSPRRSSKAFKRSKSRSPSPPAKNRSPTPPSFVGGQFMKTVEQQLDESNKGHQMLKKMGWSGAGLGSKEQGIEAPISGGEVRDRVDQYKGVGVNLHDPYENFRKSKGQAFITRMKARAEERMSTT